MKLSLYEDQNLPMQLFGLSSNILPRTSLRWSYLYISRRKRDIFREYLQVSSQWWKSLQTYQVYLQIFVGNSTLFQEIFFNIFKFFFHFDLSVYVL